MDSRNSTKGENSRRIGSLVLDAGPLIMQAPSQLSSFAEKLYTTEAVFNEIRDENARANLELLGPNLEVVSSARPECVKRISEFAKKTGDFSVLSAADIGILALTYQLEIDLNGGDWRLKKDYGIQNRKGSKSDSERTNLQKAEQNPSQDEEGQSNDPDRKYEVKDEIDNSANDDDDNDDDGWSVVPRKVKAVKQESNRAKKRRAKAEAAAAAANEKKEINKSTQSDEDEKDIEKITTGMSKLGQGIVNISEEDDDDSGWITPENEIKGGLDGLEEEIIDDDSGNNDKKRATFLNAAVATNDFAMQNVALQMGLNLVNSQSGLRIQKVRSYRLRCHGCFKLCPISENTVRRFCPNCGGATLTRVTVTTSSKTGELQVHLKKNMEWNHRGDRYSIPNPQSKTSRRTMDRNDPNVLLLREDQNEYQKAMKNEQWRKRQTEKMMDNWFGNGADIMASPFAISGSKSIAFRQHNGIRIGKGRDANVARRRV